MSDGGDTDDPQPEEAPPKSRPIYLAEMIEVVLGEAGRIMTTQAALVKCEWRKAPDAQEIRHAEVYEAVAAFLDECRPYQKKIMSIVRPGRAKK